MKEHAKKQWAAPVLLWMGACGDLEGAELLQLCRAGPPLAPLVLVVPARGHRCPPVLLASPPAAGQGTKGIPPELGHLAILVLVQTV